MANSSNPQFKNSKSAYVDRSSCAWMNNIELFLVSDWLVNYFLFMELTWVKPKGDNRGPTEWFEWPYQRATSQIWTWTSRRCKKDWSSTALVVAVKPSHKIIRRYYCRWLKCHSKRKMLNRLTALVVKPEAPGVLVDGPVGSEVGMSPTDDPPTKVVAATIKKNPEYQYFFILLMKRQKPQKNFTIWSNSPTRLVVDSHCRYIYIHIASVSHQIHAKRMCFVVTSKRSRSTLFIGSSISIE